MSTPSASSPSLLNYILSTLLVSLAWGLTTPFIRRGALLHHPAPHASLTRIDRSSTLGNISWHVLKAGWGVLDLLRSPRYAIPLVVNLTGSVWFFLLVGRAGELGLFFPGWLGGCWGGRKGGGRGRIRRWEVRRKG